MWRRSTSRRRRQIAGKIETLLLQETPIMIPYFIDGLTATTSNVRGQPDLDRAIYLNDAYKS